MQEAAANPQNLTSPAIEKMERENASLRAEVAHLKLVIKKLQHLLFGKKSERRASGECGGLQLQLDELLAEYDRINQQVAEAEKAIEVERKATVMKLQSRRSLADLVPADLERVEIIHDLPADQKVDLVSGQPMVKIGEERVEKLAWEPARCFVKAHIYPTYAAPQNPSQGVIRAPAPDFAIPGGSYDETFLAMIIHKKVAMHLPLYRIEEELRLMKINVCRQTLSHLYIASATALEPVYQCLKKFILGTGFIFTDDTPVDLQVKGAGKTIQGRMWVYATLVDGRPQMVYEFTRDRLKCRPREFIGPYKGFVHADAYPGYDHLFDPENIWECACWMHIRRKFFEAQDGPPELRDFFLENIRLLYAWERIAHLRVFTPETLLQVRDKHIRPLIDAMIARARQSLLEGRILPKSAIAGAIGYLLNLGNAVKTFLTDARLKPDNGVAERALRPLAIGRKNWLFVGSQTGGDATGMLLSLVQSCRAIGADPYEYLADVLARVQGHPAKRLAELLPINWLAAKKAALATAAADSAPAA